MTEASQPDQQPIIINGQYVKDLSFEVPGAPSIFVEMQGKSPEIPINVDVTATPLRDNVFEVVLHLKVEARLEDKPLFVAELAYGGLFTLNVPQEHLHPMVLVECPRLLFPFARAIIADLTRDGGFPPLMVQPIDFVALYRQRLQAAQAQAGDETGTA